MQTRCPTCGRPASLDADANPSRPFCNPRCRLADLGRWLDGAYRISAPIADEDLDQGSDAAADEVDADKPLDRPPRPARRH